MLGDKCHNVLPLLPFSLCSIHNWYAYSCMVQICS